MNIIFLKACLICIYNKFSEAATMQYYVEYIFAENFIIDFIMLYMTGNLIKKKINLKRLTVAALIGAIYVILTFYIGKAFMTFFIVKFSVSVLMLMIAFDLKGALANVRVVICYYIVSLIVVGIIYALSYRFDKLTTKIIFISIFLCYIMLKYFFYEIKIRKEKSYYMRDLSIEINDKSKSLKAFIDTGNELTDPITNKPVIIVNIDSIKDILGEDICKEILKFYENKGTNYSDLFLEKSYKLKLRIIKYNTISSQSEPLVCVVPDEITIFGNDKNIIKADALIGIYPRKISEKEDYDALLFKKLLDWESENYENNNDDEKVYKCS